MVICHNEMIYILLFTIFQGDSESYTQYGVALKQELWFFGFKVHNGCINGICRRKPVLYIHSNALGVTLLYWLHRYAIEMIVE